MATEWATCRKTVYRVVHVECRKKSSGQAGSTVYANAKVSVAIVANQLFLPHVTTADKKSCSESEALNAGNASPEALLPLCNYPFAMLEHLDGLLVADNLPLVVWRIFNGRPFA